MCKGPLRRYMRDGALAAASDADVVLLLLDATDRRGRLPDRLGEADAAGLGDTALRKPVIIGLNKVDRAGKPELLPVIEAWASFQSGVEVVPISAITGENVDCLEQAIARKLSAGPPLFPDGMVTDRTPQFIAQEIIREQLYHQLGKELPYACAVQVETWTERKGEVVIGAVIVVERESQKPIVVGKAGAEHPARIDDTDGIRSNGDSASARREELEDGWLDQQRPGDEILPAEQEIERHDRSNAGTDDDRRRRVRGLEQGDGVLALLLNRGPPVVLGLARSAPAAPVVADRAGPRSERLADGVPDPAVGGGFVDEQDRRALSSLAPHDLDAAGLEGGHAVPRCCARPG